MCKCCICNKEFEYGDKWSPMLKNEIWNQILNFYRLNELEKEKWNLYNSIYSVILMIRSEKAKEKLYEVLNSELLHTYICYECMKKALGRKLTYNDLISNNTPFNKEFEKNYFLRV